jgi:hypothetical protein
MNPLRLLVCSTLVGLVAPVFAQSEREIPIEFRVVRLNAFSVGVRYIGGADITFGKLGTVPSSRTLAPLSEGAVARSYANGFVSPDSRRPNELDADGNPIPTTGGRYRTSGLRVDANGNPVLDPDGNQTFQTTGDYLAFTSGFTRNWSYDSAGQATSNPGFIAMNDFSAETSGAGATADSGAGAGVEITAVRRLGVVGKMEWGILFGAGLTDINGKTSGEIRSNLRTFTDLYTLGGRAAPAAPYTGPSAENFTAADGTLFANALETTVPIGASPASRTNVLTANGAAVSGNWQIKGAYYLFRAGPVLRFPIGRRFAVTASAGYAGAYLGTRYRVNETLNLNGVAPLSIEDEDTYSKFISGTYAEANVEWLLTDRTGFFLGATIEQLGDYEQALGTRTAKVEIGGNSGFRFGMTTRF